MARKIKQSRRNTGGRADVHFLPTARIVNTTPPKNVVAFGTYPEALRFMEVREDSLTLEHGVSETNLPRATRKKSTGSPCVTLTVSRSGYFVADFGAISSDLDEIPSSDTLGTDESAVVGINMRVSPSGIVKVNQPVDVSLETDGNHVFERYTLEN